MLLESRGHRHHIQRTRQAEAQAWKVEATTTWLTKHGRSIDNTVTDSIMGRFGVVEKKQVVSPMRDASFLTAFRRDDFNW